MTITAFDLNVIRRLAIAELPQFVAWRPEQRGDKWTKIPINARTGNLASVTDPGSWCDLETAASYARTHRYGPGFVFADDPYTGVDEVEHPNDRPRLTAEKRAAIESGGAGRFGEWLAEQRQQEEARVTTAVKKLLAGHDSALELLNGPADAPRQATLPAPAAAPGNNEVVSQ